MVKWLLIVVVLLVVFSVLSQRFRAWRLPGDLNIPMRGRMYYIPIASTLLFSLLVWAISRVI